MPNPILLKFNATGGVAPTAGALTLRELAINTTDGKLFTKTVAGAVVEFARKDQVWHSGTDGAGSGLDADLLDGQEGAYYRNADNLNAGTIPAARFPSLGLYSSGSTDGSYISNGMYWNAANWRHLGTNTYGYVIRNSGVTGTQLFVARTAGTLDSVATMATYTFSPSGRFTAPAEIVATGGLNIAALAVPGQPTGTPSTAGGTIAAGTHYARIVALDVNGNATTPSVESAVVTTTGSTSSIVWSWAFVPGTISYLVWVGATGAQGNYFTTTATSYTQTAPSSTGTAGSLANYTVNFSGSVTLPGQLNVGGYVFSQYLNMSHGAGSRTADTTFYSSNDNFLRKNTAAGFKESLALHNVTNESKATMFANSVHTGSTTFPSNGGSFYLETGTGDGASTTTYNVAVRGHWGIGFRDYQNLSTVKAYIDCRQGIFAGTQLQSLVATGTAPLVVASTTVVPNLNADMVDGYQLERVVAGLRANRNINGGGIITVNASGSVLWNVRYIVMSNGFGAESSTNGYFDINCPVSGTITGVGGAANVTATAAGIPLGSWQALYYILPVGSNNASVAANFRVASYTSALSVPSDWVLICVVNGDAPLVYNFPNGIALKVSESINTTTHDARNADLLDGQQGSYYAPIVQPQFTGPTNCAVYSTGSNGWGAFYSQGSGTNSSYHFFGNITSGETGRITSNNAGMLTFSTGAGALAQLNVSHTASAVNYVNVTGSATGGAVATSAQGSDANISLNLVSKGTGVVQINGSTAWHAGNDGAASGLDADLLDGQHGSYYAPTVSPFFTGKAVVIASGTRLPASTTMAVASGDTGGLEIQPQGTAGTAGAAFMSFHRPNAYAIHFGLDTDNFLKVGGWSMGAVSHKVWHAGSDGAGSGLDADLIDGIDSTALIYGTANNGTNTAPVTWSGTHITQYKSGFFEVNAASWTPTTGYWWGINTAHTSNSASYLYGGQIIFENSATPRTYVRVTNGGASPSATAWQQVLTTTQGTYAGTLTSGQITAALGYTPGNPAGAAVSVISTGTTAVAGTTYVLIASLTLTLPASPAAGNTVTVSNRSGTVTCVIGRNAQNIMGLAEDMTLNMSSSITLLFADATRGWVLI